LINQQSSIINHQFFLLDAVFLEAIKIEDNSYASFFKFSTSSFFLSPSSIINSSQKYDSSASSITMLILTMKAALD
jgi:hypothetical protein